MRSRIPIALVYVFAFANEVIDLLSPDGDVSRLEPALDILNTVVWPTLLFLLVRRREKMGHSGEWHDVGGASVSTNGSFRAVATSAGTTEMRALSRLAGFGPFADCPLLGNEMREADFQQAPLLGAFLIEKCMSSRSRWQTLARRVSDAST